MSCTSCGPSPFSIEYQRRKKPENNQGCGCGGVKNTCDTQSLAIEDSPLYNWEKKYGKLVTTVTLLQDSFGKKIQFVEKKPCKVTEKQAKNCCSLLYKIIK